MAGTRELILPPTPVPFGPPLPCSLTHARHERLLGVCYVSGAGDQAENEADPTPRLTGFTIQPPRETRRQVVIIQAEKSHSGGNA